MIMIILIDPYQQSLPIHRRTLLFNSVIVLIFLSFINLINYL